MDRPSRWTLILWLFVWLIGAAASIEDEHATLALPASVYNVTNVMSPANTTTAPLRPASPSMPTQAPAPSAPGMTIATTTRNRTKQPSDSDLPTSLPMGTPINAPNGTQSRPSMTVTPGSAITSERTTAPPSKTAIAPAKNISVTDLSVSGPPQTPLSSQEPVSASGSPSPVVVVNASRSPIPQYDPTEVDESLDSSASHNGTKRDAQHQQQSRPSRHPIAYEKGQPPVANSVLDRISRSQNTTQSARTPDVVTGSLLIVGFLSVCAIILVVAITLVHYRKKRIAETEEQKNRKDQQQQWTDAMLEVESTFISSSSPSSSASHIRNNLNATSVSPAYPLNRHLAGDHNDITRHQAQQQQQQEDEEVMSNPSWTSSSCDEEFFGALDTPQGEKNRIPLRYQYHRSSSSDEETINGWSYRKL